jgi:hypothetical protein
MHANSIAAIKESLANLFQSAKSTDSIPLHLSVVRAAKEIYKAKKNYISQVEVQVVIADFVKNALSKKGTSTSEDVSLASIFGVQELTDIIEEIVSYFDSLPRNYTCVFKLPNVFSPRQFSVVVDETVTLEFKESRHTGTLLNALMAQGYSEYYLSIVIKHSGYLSLVDYGSPYGIFKHLVGIAVALDYLKSNPLRSALLSRGLFSSSSIHLNADSYFIDDTLGEQSRVNMHLSDSVSEKLNDLEFDSEAVKSNHAAVVDHIKNAFISFKNDENHAGRIRSALEWSFDSRFTNNATFTFILNCIAIEALMGDSSTAIGKTLGNRCAYMLAKTNKDRKYYIDEIEKLYKLRSNLVHGNQSRPGKDDSHTIYFAAALLKQLLRNELQVLLNSKR